MTIADILVFRGVGKTYSYDVSSTENPVTMGDHVDIKFGKSLASGLVLSIKATPDEPDITFKPIESINTKIPRLSAEYITLIQWFSNYYQTTPFKAYQTIIGKKKYRDVNYDALDLSISPSPFTLSDEQQQAFNLIQSITSSETHLLHGITGSGKTEIYLRLAEEQLKRRKSIIILCPEISLTPQYTTHFKGRFHDNVCLLHSGLTPKQKEIEWNKIMSLDACVIIGPRSAIFAPAKRLGMIVIDEEHDLSYKQENHPRYDTIDIAKWRSKYHQCPVVLGSATPCVESYASAKHLVVSNQKQSYSQLTQRVSGHPLPDIKVIDMLSIKQSGSFELISNALHTAILSHLENKKKVIILINRRGFATHISCQRCGNVLQCQGCGLSYTYHQNKTFHCHRCDNTIPITNTCPSCHKNQLGFSGIGIQKVVLECKQAFPNANIIRLDKDNTSTSKQLENTLNEFKQNGDILIGTQLIAKGHHIEDVTLVGVIGIDTILNLPDYRSSERAFQLLLQVAGRSGRGKDPGEVIVQTFQPHHYIFNFVKSHHYLDFVKQELAFRKQLFYPPFSSMIHLIISSESADFAIAFGSVIESYLREQCNPMENDIMILGPKPSPIEKIKHFFRFQILLKFPESKTAFIKKVLSDAPKPTKKVRFIIDFSPKQLL